MSSLPWLLGPYWPMVEILIAVPLTALDDSHAGPVDVTFVGETFLRTALLVSHLSDPVTQSPLEQI